MTEAGSSFEPEDTAEVPLLLTTEGGEAFSHASSGSFTALSVL